MSHLRRIPHLARLLAAFACALLGLALSAPAAFALRVQAPGGTSGVGTTGSSPTFTRTVVSTGMPGWQVAVIVAVVAILAAAIAIAADRARGARRTRIAPAH